MKNEFTKNLEQRGWTRNANGDLSAPSRQRPHRPVGELGASVRIEHEGPLDHPRQALQGGPLGVFGGSEGGGRRRAKRTRPGPNTSEAEPIVQVCILCIRQKRLDDDNLANGCKSLRDAIAAWIGIDDGDLRIAWEYRQIISKPVGTIVIVSEI